MNMTEQDWEKVLGEHQQSVDSITTVENVEEQTYYQTKPQNDNQICRFIRIERSTAKAKFYVTHETLGEVHGFWCPNVAAIMRDDDIVEVAHWCKIKIINFR